MEDLDARLKSRDESERLFAVQDILDEHLPDAASKLTALLMVEESQLVRDAIVFSLKGMPCAPVYDALFNLFRAPDAYLRNAAVSIFGREGDEAIGFLTSYLDHTDKEVRKLILDALFQIGSQEALLAIRACLHDDAPNVQITAVEYLGRLEDKGSLEEMTALFRNEPEPMLRSTILESLCVIGNGGSVHEVLGVLMPGGSYSEIEPFYLPQVIALVAKAGELDDVYGVLDSVQDVPSCADDIMRAISQARCRFEDRFDDTGVFEKVVAIAGNSEIREEVRYAAATHILGKDRGALRSEEIHGLGCRLAAEESMIYAGVRFLASSGMEAGREMIREVMESTKDEDLRALCVELMGRG